MTMTWCRIALLVLVLVLLLGAAAGQGPAADWPQFRGPGGAGVSSVVGLPATWGPQENLAWKTTLPGPGASSPIVIGQKIFLTSFSGTAAPDGALTRHLLCLDARNGAILWDTPVAAKLPEQGNIRESHGYASSTPVADTERVYAFFGKSGVYAFDHAGKLLWQSDVGSRLHGWGSAASPVLYRDLVIVNASVESESLVALHRKTGAEVWRASGIKESWSTPLLVTLKGGKMELIVPVFGKVLAFDPDSGKPLWSCATDIPWYMVPSLVAANGVVYVLGGRPGSALAIRCGGTGDVTATHRLWTGKKGSNVSSPVYHDGYLYWANDSLGLFYCAEANTGTIVYEERMERPGQVYAAALLADGKLFYTTRDGRTFVVACAPTYQLLAVNSLGERSAFNASPIVAGGRLLIRSDRFLYCLGKP